MLNRVQKRFLIKILQGIGIAFVSVITCFACILFWRYIVGLEKDVSALAGMITVIAGTFAYTGLQIAWSKSKWEVEEETRKIEQALKNEV